VSGSEQSPKRLGAATRKVAAVATPRDLDRDLPGRSAAHGFEIGLTPVVFGAIGWLIDRAAGTLPVFTIVFVVFGVVALCVRHYYTYKYMLETETAAAAAGGRPVHRRRSRVGQR
jgi:F0F1-type ATP synthase assembly protein I